MPKAKVEFSDRVVSKGPCTKCDTEKGCVTYDDGHTHCFACGHTTGPTLAEEQGGGEPEARAHKAPTAPSSSPLLRVEDHTAGGLGYVELSKRRLKVTTLRRFGYFLAGLKGQTVHVAPYFNKAGEVVVQKVRTPDKGFFTLGEAGSLNDCLPFGQPIYGDRFDRRVVVCEGEIDAMTVAQVLDFKCAVVSINGGIKAAAKCMKSNYLWFDRFTEIVLFFDDDAPGKEGTEECARLFKVGKVRIAKVPGFKDASEALQADRPGDVEAAIYSAVTWRPRGIVNARDSVSDVLAPTERVVKWDYPPAFAKLQEMTGGMHRGEVIYHVAGTGVGKSSALREIQKHLIDQGVKIAVLSFEDTIREAKLGLMSIHEGERLQLRPVPDPEDRAAVKAYDADMKRIHQAVFGSGLVELFDPETAEWTMDAIIAYVRYCARALDCVVIFIDPLSFVASGIDLTADERRVLDKVAAEFARISKELGVHIQISHHLKRVGQGVPHEEGAPTSLNELRSSGGLANFAMGVIGWERNNQAAGDAWRVTQCRVIKPLRRTGRSGLADVLYYGEDGRLRVSTIPFPPMGKPDGEDEGGERKHGPRGFSALGSGDTANSTDY
jgi:twinkle protein